MRREFTCFRGAFFAVLLLSVLLSGCGRLMGGYKLDEQGVDGSYKQTEGADAGQSAIQKNIQIQINAEPEAERASGRCNLMAGNSSENRSKLQVTVTLDQSGQVIYESPVMAPGERVAWATLENLPEPGVYPATASFIALGLEDEKPTATVDAGIMLTVK